MERILTGGEAKGWTKEEVQVLAGTGMPSGRVPVGEQS